MPELVHLEVDDGVRLWFDRVAVWQVTPKDAPAAPAASEKDAPKRAPNRSPV